ncbi:hypothetical protein BD310DRAFT_1012392, partial [Dichomitus squalens]
VLTLDRHLFLPGFAATVCLSLKCTIVHAVGHCERPAWAQGAREVQSREYCRRPQEAHHGPAIQDPVQEIVHDLKGSYHTYGE